MVKLKFNVTWFEYIKTIGYISPLILDDLKERIIEEFQKGNSIVVQMQYTNSAPDIITVI